MALVIEDGSGNTYAEFIAWKPRYTRPKKLELFHLSTRYLFPEI